MEKITLVCTSINPSSELFNRMFHSAKGFDEKIIHIDKDGFQYFKNDYLYGINCIPEHLTIPDAYNLLIENVKTEWICVFCDDDFFYPEGLKAMIDEVHKGIDADVAHFKFRITGHRPPQDLRAWFLGNEYVLCEKQPITPQLLGKHNRLPAGSFFRKSAWERCGGFEGIKNHDHVFWLKLAIAGCKFKYFDTLVYEYHRRGNSAWIKQNKK